MMCSLPLWLTAFIMFCSVSVFMLVMVLFLVLFERRVSALLTLRYGPNRVGFEGILQTVADAIKLLCKEDICPRAADKALFFLAPLVVFCPVLIIYFFLPFSSTFTPVNSDVSLILFCAIGSVSILGFFMAGYASNNKFSLLAAYRSVSQAIAYETPLLLCVLAIAILAGSFNLSEIVALQWGGILHWFFLPSLIGFIVFFISMLAQLNRTPFDLAEAESELVAGYHTEYSGMKFAMFFLAEYALLFALSAFFVTIFLGGYLSPLSLWLLPPEFVFVEQFFWLFLKTFGVIFFIILIRASLPRLRIDQLLNLSYKVLIPFSIFNLIIVIVYKFIRSFIWNF